MSVTRLTCPECSKVLRPAKPVPAGKKVKCPECEHIFLAPDDEEPDRTTARPAKKPAGKATASKGAPSKKADPPKKKEEDENTYGVVKDEKEEDEESKPKINYAPDDSIKDLRGPAVNICIPPSTKLMLVGSVGFIGWLLVLFLMLIPRVFPITDTGGPPKPILKITRGLSMVNPQGGGGFPGGVPGVPGGQPPAQDKKKEVKEEDKGSLYEAYGLDLMLVCYIEFWQYLLVLLLLCAMMAYCGCVVYGAIQMQTLESRGWGMAGSIMAMIPLTVGGVQTLVAILLNLLLGLIMDDQEYIQFLTTVLLTFVWLAGLGVGLWNLLTLNKEEVIAGFEYVAE